MPSPGKPKTCLMFHSRSRASSTSATVSVIVVFSFVEPSTPVYAQ